MLVLINLDRAFLRRASMEAQLKEARLSAERVGTDLRALTVLARGRWHNLRFRHSVSVAC